jgi:hypothetical protein
MGFEHYIETAFKGVLTNPLISLLKEIRMGRILWRSHFVKREVGYPVYSLLLHFLYMLVMNYNAPKNLDNKGHL